VLASIDIIQFLVVSIVFEAVYGLTVNVVVPAAAVAIAVTQRKKLIYVASVLGAVVPTLGSKVIIIF
jgi:hypothetical protein